MNKKSVYLYILLLVFSACDQTYFHIDDPRILILMYHRITSGEATNLYERSAADLENDLRYLHDNNIRVIDFAELGRIASGELQLDTHAVLLTFDDGDHSWSTIVAPLLKKYQMKATFFLWVSKIGANSFLSWDEVELMSNYIYDDGVRPFAFGSHTMSHQYLLTMKTVLGGGEAFDEYLDEEFGSSKRLIDSHIYGNVVALSLPFGDGAGDADILAGAQRNGYSYIRTSEYGTAESSTIDLFRLPSLPILDDSESDIIGTYLGI
jgi:peptidoglycan/xylan/chitin deacetylase (PgdA/CDA1 family)